MGGATLGHGGRFGLACLRAFVGLSVLCSCSGELRGQTATVAGPVVTSAGAVHAMGAAEARRGLPVRFRGVVTFYDNPTSSMFVSDATGGVYLWTPKDPPLRVKGGTMVEITGVTQPGDFASIVLTRSVRVLGPLRKSIPATRVTVLQLATGRYDCQWVEVEGLIRSVSRAGHMAVLKIATRDGAILALTSAVPGENYERLVNAWVKVSGVAAIEYNKHQQMTGSHLFLPSLDTVRVLHLVKGDPYALPVAGIGQLAQFGLRLGLADRVHLRGRVSLQWPGHVLCVQDATGGLCVETPLTEPYAIGTLVDVVGYPVFAAQIPALSDAMVRQRGTESAPPAARPVTPKDLMGGDYSGKLVSLEGELVGLSSDSRAWQLSIRSQQMVFSTSLAKGATSQEIGNLRIGSYVQVTGVCVDEVDPRMGQDWRSEQQIASFRLMLRRRADVLVLRNPSWWTPAHTWITLSTAVFLTLAIFCWVVLLRRKVEQRTQELRESERRFRHLAHHDSLTALPNRAWFHERAEMALDQARRRRECVGLLLLDLDHFKPVNDTLGHDAGDLMLCTLAERVLGAVRKVDTVARLGGDEFAVVLSNVGDGMDAEDVAQKILSAICHPVAIKGQQVPMSASIGVAVFPSDGDSVTELLRSADLAMYESKKLARGGVRRYRSEITLEEVESMVEVMGLG